MKTKIKVIIQAYKLCRAGVIKEREIAEQLKHHAQCVVYTQKIKLIEEFISELSKLII